MNADWPREVRRRADGAGAVYELPVRPLGGLRWLGLAPVAFSILFVWGPVHSLIGTIQRWADGTGHGGGPAVRGEAERRCAVSPSPAWRDRLSGRRKMCDQWGRFMNWQSNLVLGFALAAMVSRLCAAEAPTNALPSFETLLKGIAERAQADARVEQEFEACYSFTRTKTREEFTLKGKLKKREIQQEVHDPAAPKSGAGPSPAKEGKRTSGSRSHVPPKAVSDDEPPDRAYERKDVLVTEQLLRRFQFTLVGREVWDGLSLLKLDFRPAAVSLPAKGLLERLINRVAGTIWVDETDFTVARASFYLTEKVNVGAGVLGSVSAFDCWFERRKTEDGLWHTRRVDWRVECREFLVNKIIEQRESWDEVRKVKPP